MVVHQCLKSVQKAASQRCDICYGQLQLRNTNHVLDGLALMNCNHWFCLRCWRHHVLHRILAGDTALQCPVSFNLSIFFQVYLVSLQ